MRKIILSSLVVLSSCSLGSRPVSSVYMIEPEVKGELKTCSKGKRIEVASPTSSAGLESRRIAVFNDGKLDYYTGARWASAPTDMFQQTLVESLEKSGSFNSVSTDLDGAAVDTIIRTDIRDYQVTDTANPTVKITATVKLINSDTRQVIATIPVKKEITPAANKTQDIVDAFSKATAEATADIVKATKRKIGGC